MRTKPPKSASGHIRIIAGQWRRHQLPVLVHEGLRPSSDRVRETVFNWLNHIWGGQFTDKRILDLFAGTGAFGLECISRGARAVELIDAHAPAIAAINNTLKHWQQHDDSIGQVHALHSDALTRLKHWAQLTSSSNTAHPASPSDLAFDLIILDPPFGHDWLMRIFPLLTPILHPNTLIYLETERNISATHNQNHPHQNPDTQSWVCLRQGHTQQVDYALWQVS